MFLFEAVICGCVILFFLVLWVLEAIGVALPVMERILLVMFASVVILSLTRLIVS